MRADAERNREKIINAASNLFNDVGTSVSLNEIAAHADVGIATLLRRFPSKQAIIEEVFARDLDFWLDSAGEARRSGSPGLTFLNLTRTLLANQARHPHCADLLVHAFLRSDRFAERRETFRADVEFLIRRGVEEGEIYPDTTWSDLVLLIESAGALALLDPHHAEEKIFHLLEHFERSFKIRVN
ncbi:TetR/AcrR family transcriptional regulator [Pseudarthrobacter sp. PS3-L1]|uniref:TetR/AcrR family transcriptional regulator n=1 Tax=Pseudarthrobacter sp. PS3-L1 TaxID=3046207 RepID=UPI0024B8F75C|nr:TetR/AcrR family transcriptional regulator [Pseudarthrobacter sp. PS3-L1]MDJ0318976.1 TetR/AcrR family transcriptional regulator [Pseudarthrobacter sp. PS3-L1]